MTPIEPAHTFPHARRSATMPTDEPVKILVVDDLSEKLLVYRTVLEEPGVEVVCAQSGAEALMHLLSEEFAVILLDVNMPGMDGFETAALIRSRRRCAHTPIIFVTAHTDELHTLRGYSYGAVDYMLSPIVPQILRTKVRVFLELFRLNRQVRRQADLQIQRARTEHDRLATVLENAADFVAQADAHGRLTYMNRAGRAMLGLGDRPQIPRDLDTLQPPWAATLLAQEGIPAAIRDGVWMGESAFLSTDGREIPVSQVILSHTNPDGQVDALSFIARDIGERKHAERAMAESERRYRELLHAMPAAVYVCDMQGRIVLFNEAARTLWGREPVLGKERFCGAFRAYWADGSPFTFEDSPMSITLRERRPVRDVEVIVERPDGSRSHVMPHPQPMLDADGNMIGAVNVLVDITERKRGESARALLAAIVESTDDAVISETLEGVITSANPGAERLYGYAHNELVNRPVSILIPADRADEESVLFERIRRGEHVQHFETVRLAKDGRRIDVSLSVSPVRDIQGRVIGASKIARDITERKRSEMELKRHREHLEHLVQERTAELEASHQRLRLSDRLASIGTLAAGLGHDMGNLLLPIRMRLEVLEQSDLPDQSRADIQAISSACEYLKQLSQGLRLFALNPDDAKASGETSDMCVLWTEIAPFLRNALPRDAELESDLPRGLPPVKLSPHVLTQALYNLIKNAGDAFADRPSGRVRVCARPDGSGRAVVLSVIDNGPGMTEEVQRRCLEPFYTTKTRGISTGLGLALVTGALRRVGGQISIESGSGGTTFHLTLPAAVCDDGVVSGKAPDALPAAAVSISDLRLRSYVVSLLKAAGVRAQEDPWSTSAPPEVLIVNATTDLEQAVSGYLSARPDGRAIVLADAPPSEARERTIYLGSRPSSMALREAIRCLDPVAPDLGKGGSP